jgi:hypothetical protein
LVAQQQRCIQNAARQFRPVRYAWLTDIIVVHVGRPYFLELKRDGAYQSAEQKAFQRRAEDAGALYAVVRSIDDVQALGL